MSINNQKGNTLETQINNLLNDYKNLDNYKLIICRDYEKISKDNYTEKDWNNNCKKVKEYIETFEEKLSNLEKSYKELPKKDNNIPLKLLNKLEPVENFIKIDKNKVLSKINTIKEKTKKWKNVFEDKQNDLTIEKKIVKVEDLSEDFDRMNKIKGTMEDLKFVMESMSQAQEEMLNNIEKNVIKNDDNAEKAKEEIKKANEKTKENKKKKGCILY